jgi:tRNA G10  N-methylase Trm11
MNAATLCELPPGAAHPAKYTDVLLPTMAKMLQGRRRILDPFGGTGKVFLLEHWLGNVDIQAVEIEPEWAARNPRTTLGNALHLPWPDNTFDAICTSPTYGNRMADRYSSTDPSERMTYAALLERQLHPDNSGAMQWGERYWRFHTDAWKEARRVLVEGGLFVLNIKDHIRAGKLMPVTDWHAGCLRTLGFRLVEHVEIDTPAMRYGRNGELRVPYESVILFALEHKP